MNVAQLLNGKGREVASIQPDRTLAEAVHLLSQQRIGALVVMGSDGTLLGMISERDIVRALGEGGASALDQAVSRVMTAKVVTCREKTSIDELMETMTIGRFRHIPVVEDGRVCGIVSIGDVVKHRVAAIEAESQAMRDYIAMA